MADSGPATGTPKSQGNFSCQRCRRRKQKCNRGRPCDNCVQAGEVCLPSERLARRSLISPQYTRSLENRIAELEAQVVERRVEQQQESVTPVESSAVAQNRPSSAQVPTRQSHQSPAFFHAPTEDIQTPVTIQASSPTFSPTPDYSRYGFTSNPHTHAEPTRNGQIFSTQQELALIQAYLERVNPRYPFLHEDTFLEWHSSWKALQQNGGTIPPDEYWKCFFIQMAFAVSLLIASQVSPEERSLSNTLYSSALSYFSAVSKRPDPVLHVQAYLMCTIHALHSPCSQTVLTMISTTIRCCVISQLHRSTYEPPTSDSSSLHEVQIRRRVFWSAYSIDRLISWIYHVPCSLADENIQTELFANINDSEIQTWDPMSRPQASLESAPRQTQVSSALHLIRVRRIQSRILGIMMRADYDDNFSPYYGWRLHIMKELDEWRNHLQPHSDPRSRGYTSQGWVGMAYNYTILLLHRPTKENLSGLVIDKCLPACADILSVFRRYQKDRQTAQLWPGLLSQFGVGITLLYCIWGTPPSNQPGYNRSPKTLTAIQTCSVILAVFSEQWTEAEPLRDLFDILSESILYHPLSSEDDATGISTDAASSIKTMMPHIMSIVVNTDIRRMITEMVNEDYPWRSRYSSDFPTWSSEMHCPETCVLCAKERNTDNVQGLGAGKELYFGDFGFQAADSQDDEFLAFHGLFGSVEF